MYCVAKKIKEVVWCGVVVRRVHPGAGDYSLTEPPSILACSFFTPNNSCLAKCEKAIWTRLKIKDQTAIIFHFSATPRKKSKIYSEISSLFGYYRLQLSKTNQLSITPQSQLPYSTKSNFKNYIQFPCSNKIKSDVDNTLPSATVSYRTWSKKSATTTASFISTAIVASTVPSSSSRPNLRSIDMATVTARYRNHEIPIRSSVVYWQP